MSVSESCKSRRGGRSKGAGATLVSVSAKQSQLSSQAGITIHSSTCDGAAAATEVQHLRRKAPFPPPSNASGLHIPLTQRLEQRQEGCTSVAAAAANGEGERKAFPPCRALPPIASFLNASSHPEAKAGRDSGVAADNQPASKVKSSCLLDKTPGTTTDVCKPISLRPLGKTFGPAYNSAAASAVAATATPLPAVTRAMHAPATTGGCETRSDTITTATTFTTHATAVHVAAESRVADIPAPVAAPAAAVAVGRGFIGVDARGDVCGAEKYDGVAGESADEAAASNGGAEETADLKAWERQLLLQSPGGLVLQQAPAGVSRAELSEFFRKYGPLQPPGDGLYFPSSRRQQLLVRFQRLQDAVKCVRLLQQQQRRQQVVRGACGAYDDAVSGVAARSGSGALAGALNKAAEGGDCCSTHGLQQQSTDLQDVLQQEFQLPSVSTSINTIASRQQGGVKNDVSVNDAECCEEGNRSLSSSALLGYASLQLSRADKIKISALRGYRRAVQLLRSEGILQSLQQQQQQQRAEQTRGQQEMQSQMRKPQEQQIARLSTTHDRVKQITVSAKEREGSLLQMRSISVISTAPCSAGPAAPAQQQQEGYVGTQKTVYTTQEGAAAHSAAPRKRGSASVGGIAKGEKSVSPSRVHTVDEEKEGRVKRRIPQQMQLLGEKSSDAAVPLTAPSAATRQQQPKHAALATAVAGATGISRNITSAAAASRGKAVRQSSSNSLLELLSGAAVVEHLEKEEAAAAAAAGWGNSGGGGQNSKLQQQRSQTAGWGEATALDPVHDAERIHHLRGYPPAASAAAYPPPPG